MKKMLLKLLFVFAIATNSSAQNGFTNHFMPSSFPNMIRPNDIKVDHNGNKWIAYFRGVVKFDGSNWTHYGKYNASAPFASASKLAVDNDGNIWAATNTYGLAKFNGSTWTMYTNSNSDLPVDCVLTVYAQGNDIWAGTTKGVAKFNGSTWTIYNKLNSPLLSDRVRSITSEKGGDIWIGTEYGLYQKSGNNWTTYTINNSSITTNTISSLYIDDLNNKWIGSPYNVCKFDGNTFSSLNSILLPLNIIPELSVSQGPQGGILFSGEPDGYNFHSTIYEMIGDRLHHYSPDFISDTLSSPIFTYDPVTKLVWIAHNKKLVSFDYSKYVGNSILSPMKNLSTLDINQVNATLLNKGDMHWNTQVGGYEVPKGSGRKALFASSLWMGGIDNTNQLHIAAMTYRQRGADYWPGPLSSDATIDSVTSAKYDKIWKVNRLQIEEFKQKFASGQLNNGTYAVPSDIITWPSVADTTLSKELAPFVDVNHDGLYKPLVDGDYPLIKGDQMCYWIFNDKLKLHTETGSAALGVEVHASAYAYACSNINDSLKALNYTTFYNYKIINKSSIQYDSTYLGIWQDVDLGSASDDYIGCNKSGNYGFVYNGDNVDDNAPSGQIPYGEKPPMLSTVILNGPLADPDGLDNDNNGTIDDEHKMMTNFMYYDNNSTPTGNPNSAMDYYGYMNSVWKDGSHLTYGGNGYQGATNSNFMFDGEVYDFGDTQASGWSEGLVGNVPADRRMLMSCGPFTFQPGASVNLDYAIVYTRDEQSTYSVRNLYNKNKADVERVQRWFDANQFPSCLDTHVGVEEKAQSQHELNIYPNPATESITINNASTEKCLVTIYDVTGKIVKTINMNSSSNTISISELHSGIYLLNVYDGKTSNIKRFIKQ